LRENIFQSKHWKKKLHFKYFLFVKYFT
jgi:hypothetical protein